jgi:hypothetical protein
MHAADRTIHPGPSPRPGHNQGMTPGAFPGTTGGQ